MIIQYECIPSRLSLKTPFTPNAVHLSRFKILVGSNSFERGTNIQL